MSAASRKSIFPKVGLAALVVGLVVGSQPSVAAPKGGLGGSGLDAGAAASTSNQGNLNATVPGAVDQGANVNANANAAADQQAQTGVDQQGASANTRASASGDTDVASNVTPKHHKQKSE